MRVPTVADPPARSFPAQALVRYFRRLWLGEQPLSRAFWYDMLVVATLVNLATFLVAIFLFVGDAPAAYGVAVLLSHIPYNIVVFAGVWRSAARENSGWSWPAQMIALAWLVVSFFI